MFSRHQCLMESIPMWETEEATTLCEVRLIVLETSMSDGIHTHLGDRRGNNTMTSTFDKAQTDKHIGDEENTVFQYIKEAPIK